MQQRTSAKASSRWTKIHAHSNTKVAHARTRESHQERLSEMRKPPKIATDYTVCIALCHPQFVFEHYED